MKRIVAFASLALLPAQSVLADDKPCVTRPELHAGITYFLPTVVEGVKQKCAATLPTNSYFATRGTALVNAYNALSKHDSPELISLMGKVGLPKGEAPAGLGKPMAEIAAIMVNAKVQEGIKPETCPTIDQALGLLDPLPAANMVGLVELFVDVMTAADVKKGKKPFLCSAPGKEG
jgi:hypothetical protein